MNKISRGVVVGLVVSIVGLPQTSGMAFAEQRRHGGYEDRGDRDRHEGRRDRDRHEDRRDRDRDDDRRDHNRRYSREWRNYDYRRFEPGQRRYDAARYYRSYRDDGRQYRAWRLGRNDRIYRGYDNRYYCRRDDGTTGLIVGAIAGGVLGHVIAPGDSKTLGTLLGAGGGALLGRAIDGNDISCR